MGLDMYLKARRQFWPHEGDDAKRALKVLNSEPLFKLPGMQGNLGGSEEAVNGIEVEFLYWRKANHIHAWFVKYVQGGKDECETVSVSWDQLAALHSDLKKVWDAHSESVAQKILPTQKGFFFGGTEYDDYYWADCKKTLMALNELFMLPEGERWSWDFYYSSSW